MIEMIAMTTMMVDHIGIIFFPDYPFFRVIGRLALPLYAWGIVQGYYYTRSLKNYQKRLLWLAVLSQIPFGLIVGFRLNVIFTFLICILVLRLLESQNSAKYILVLLLALFAHFFSDYGAYAIGLVLIYKYLKGYRIAAAHAVLDIVSVLLFGWFLQPFSLLATLIILNRDKLRKVKLNKYFYRSFYPAHLMLLWFISQYMEGGL